VFWPPRERFENGEIDIGPDDDHLATQLGAIKWKLASRGQIQIESTDEMRESSMPSPARRCPGLRLRPLRRTGCESHQGESITGDLRQKTW